MYCKLHIFFSLKFIFKNYNQEELGDEIQRHCFEDRGSTDDESKRICLAHRKIN